MDNTAPPTTATAPTAAAATTNTIVGETPLPPSSSSSSSSSSRRSSKEYEEEIKHLKATLRKTNRVVKRYNIEIRTIRFLYEDVSTSLSNTEAELLETQKNFFLMAKKRERVLEYTKWIDEHKKKGEEANVPAKYIHQCLS